MDEVEYLGASGTVLSANLYLYCENYPVIRVDYSGHAPTIVGFGFQFYINISWFGCGFEVVWYTNKQVSTNNQSRYIPYVYFFSEAGIESLSSKLSSLFKEIGKKPDRIFNPKTFKSNFNFSICFFVIFANSDFDDPTDYEGVFKSVSLTLRNIKSYVATSSTCVSIGGGGHSKRYAVSSAVSDYWLITSSYSSFSSIRNKVQLYSNNYV